MRIHNAALIFLTTSLSVTTSCATTFVTSQTSKSFAFHRALDVRGGDGEATSLEDRVHAAMRKLGITSGGDELEPEDNEGVEDGNQIDIPEGVECKDGICELKEEDLQPPLPSPTNTETFQQMSERLSGEMNVDLTIVQAAIGATMHPNENKGSEEQRLDEVAARKMIQNEVDAIGRVLEDSDEVKQLVSEGHDAQFARRALAFADMNIDTARAILQADDDDLRAEEEALAQIEAEREEEAKRAQLRAEAAEEKERRENAESEMTTVNVDAGFDPTKPATGSGATANTVPGAPPQGAPKPAKKEDVVFQATSENLQRLVLESPVPVLLDVYADWCGPCKALTPALEQMAVKAGGMFRLVKLNTDEERTVSGALEVQSLPTIFGIKDGKIVHSFKGMPRDEEFMKNFMMGLFTGSGFAPEPTEEEKAKYDELSNKLIKIASSSGFSFAQRERLQVRTNNKLDELVEVRGDMAAAEESAKIIRSLLSNIIRDPFAIKFRKVNLENKVIAARVGAFTPAISILKSVGFATDKDSPTDALIIGKGKKLVNVAPLTVARDTIDKWIDLNRRAIATAQRKKQDEIARAKLLEEVEDDDDDEEEEEQDAPETDSNACNLKLRIEGKNKIHDIQLNADDTLKAIVDALPCKIPEGEEIQITCTSRRLIVKSSNEEAMGKTLRESRLAPAAAIVVKIGSGAKASKDSTTSIKERAAARKQKSKGEHTMASIGIYSKDDNAKGELIDGGGGVWYEHDVSSDDEGEETVEQED